jgi:hypothetical protein
MNSNSVTRNTRWLAPLVAVLAATASCCSCADPSDSRSVIQDRVNAVRGHTVPADATALNSSGPTLRNYVATANWEFETGSAKDVYLSWLSQQLERDDFKLKSSNESNLVFTKSSRDESESVSVQIAPSNEKLHVEVAYTLDSD